MHERVQYRICVVREGWNGGVDELAEIIGLRFSQPAIRVRQDLQRLGRFEVPGLGTFADSQRVVSELVAAGVQAIAVEVPVDGGERGDATFLDVVGARTMGDGERPTAPERTLLGMGRSNGDDTFVAGRGPAVIPESDSAPEGAEAFPSAWQAIVSPTPPPIAARTEPAPEAVARAAAGPDRGWSAVLGNVLHDRLVDAAPRGEGEDTVVLPPTDGPGGLAGLSGRSEDPPLTPSSAEPVGDHEPTRLMQPKARAADAPPPLRERRYERLRPPPADTPTSAHSPLAAGLWSVLAPGAGQAYNGDLQRGISFAIGGLLVVPWFWSIVDAVLRAADLRSRGRVPRSNPVAARLALVGGFWVAAAVVLASASVAVRVLTDDGPQAVPVADAPQTPRPTVQARPVGGGSDDEVDLAPAEQLRVRQQEAALLVLEAQAACGAGEFVECRRLAEAALSLDDRSRAAQQIHARAIAGVFQTDDAPVAAEGSSGAREGSM